MSARGQHRRCSVRPAATTVGAQTVAARLEPARVLVLAAPLFALAVLLSSLMPTTARAASPDRGQDLYGRYCANCHGQSGRPVWPGTPDFKRSASLMRPDAQLVAVIRQGKGVMPAYAGIIKDREMLDLIAYLRTLY